MKFLLFSVTKAMWDKREPFNYYVEKLRENGYNTYMQKKLEEEK